MRRASRSSLTSDPSLQGARVDLQDRLPPGPVGQPHRHLPVEAARPQQGRVQHVRAVGGRDHDDAGLVVEAVHLHQQLVEGLLPLVVAPAQPGAPLAADRVDLVHEDDGGGGGLGLGEEVAHPACAHADEHLHELRGGDAEEGHARLARDRPGQEGLARPGRADQQHAPGQASPELSVALRSLQEVDHLQELGLRLHLARHVGEGDPGLLLVVEASLAAAEAEHRLGAPLALASHEEQHPHEQGDREQADRQVQQPGPAGGVLGRDDHAMLVQQREKTIVTTDRHHGRESGVGHRSASPSPMREAVGAAPEPVVHGLKRLGKGGLEDPLSVLPCQVHARHVVRSDLLQEGGVREGCRGSGLRDQEGVEVPGQQQRHSHPPHPPHEGRGRGTLRLADGTRSNRAARWPAGCTHWFSLSSWPPLGDVELVARRATPPWSGCSAPSRAIFRSPLAGRSGVCWRVERSPGN